jgi:hypothetical protein
MGDGILGHAKISVELHDFILEHHLDIEELIFSISIFFPYDLTFLL